MNNVVTLLLVIGLLPSLAFSPASFHAPPQSVCSQLLQAVGGSKSSKYEVTDASFDLSRAQRSYARNAGELYEAFSMLRIYEGEQNGYCEAYEMLDSCDVKYLSDSSEREAYQIFLHRGQVVDSRGRVVCSRGFCDGLFVMDRYGKFYFSTGLWRRAPAFRPWDISRKGVC